MKARFGIILSGLLLLTACSDTQHMNHGSSYAGKTFSSPGERIYFTGLGSDGLPIPITGGHHHMQMHGGGCVTCHGETRQGGIRMWPWFWESAPAITPEALTGNHEAAGHDHSHYDAKALAQAITQGLEPDGDTLDDLMPRWQLTDQDLNALIDYLLNTPADTE